MSEPGYRHINVDHSEWITRAELNRPETRNAIHFGVMEDLERLLDRLEQDEACRLFVFTGTGKSFVSGGDLRDFHQLKTADDAKKMTTRMISILDRIEQLPFWTLAAINGHAFGGGWEMALAFDFRIAAEPASIGFTQGMFYLPPGWDGFRRLPAAVGRAQARYLLASQAVLTATEAKSVGYLQEVVPEAEWTARCEALANTLTMNDRSFISFLKQGGNDDSVEPFGRFWESDEHFSRVDDFLRKKP
ncbi:MAG: enoyl-CoA hydratase/isomerase family protein [Balneolaceae bacterium]